MSRIPASVQLTLMWSAMRGALFDSPAVSDGSLKVYLMILKNTQISQAKPRRGTTLLRDGPAKSKAGFRPEHGRVFRAGCKENGN